KEIQQQTVAIALDSSSARVADGIFQVASTQMQLGVKEIQQQTVAIALDSSSARVADGIFQVASTQMQ
ncbi:hypothetical protein C0U44_32550, partial [Klebsiella pneumoniae]